MGARSTDQRSWCSTLERSGGARTPGDAPGFRPSQSMRFAGRNLAALLLLPSLLFVRPAPEALSEAMLEQLESKEHAGAALQKEAAARNLSCKVQVKVGAAVDVVTEVANAGTHLVVTSCPSDRKSPDHQRVQSFLRESRNPVLIV